MAARVFVLLFVGVVAAASLAFLASDLDRRASDSRARIQRAADRVASAAAILARAPQALRPVLLGPGPEAPRWLDQPVAIAEPDPALAAALERQLGPAADIRAGRPAQADCGVPHPPDRSRSAPPPPPPPGPADPTRGPDCRFVTLRLADGARISLLEPLGPKPPTGLGPGPRPVFLMIVALAAAGLAFAVASVAVAPLGRLARAAEGLGEDLDRAPLRPEGPSEVRRAALAFNAMQSRLRRNLAQRTQMLAAITHDLRTPLTRLRLRLEQVNDPALREALLRDHHAMVQLVNEGLELARLESPTEPIEDLDVDSLLQSLADDAVEAGEPVECGTLTGGVVTTRPTALRRCLANLIDNAVKHAGSARLSSWRDAGGRLVIAVQDRGPGLPEDALSSAFEPFVRLGSSASRASTGVGLGLTIAKALAERSGADLTLANRSEGGLEARLTWRR